ncbi:hypothetical protein IJJ36_01580 [Candidatus Saccharibacteria bacterium]|nr:hypothetical protein [Candidatus Saccharibacteria bacterium]MBQ6461106.1 hypothetical protein [Candidatus Saccharibacteria bacterium]
MKKITEIPQSDDKHENRALVHEPSPISTNKPQRQQQDENEQKQERK